VPTFILSPPPSANKLYFNVAGKGRRKSREYCAWIKGEMKALIAQRAKPVEGCATITITLPRSRGDVDNKIKPTIDLLVRAGILRDDRSDFVSGVSVSFGENIEMMHVTITPAP